MIDKANKVAIVTGGSRGIGVVVAERLARDGFAVIVNYSANAAHAETLVRQIEARGGRALAARADVSDPDAMRGMFDAAERALGGIDVLVNNAGSPIPMTNRWISRSLSTSKAASTACVRRRGDCGTEAGS